jgi:hypothetical protein
VKVVRSKATNSEQKHVQHSTQYLVFCHCSIKEVTFLNAFSVECVLIIKLYCYFFLWCLRFPEQWLCRVLSSGMWCRDYQDCGLDTDMLICKYGHYRGTCSSDLQCEKRKVVCCTLFLSVEVYELLFGIWGYHSSADNYQTFWVMTPFRYALVNMA